MPTMPDPNHLPGVHIAPNIQEVPDIYEIENQAVDPDFNQLALCSTKLPE